MNILFLSHNYPPEVNAPARRLFEHASRWSRNGHTIEVVTAAPNFPEGVVYPGYKNRFESSVKNNIRITRIPSFIAANQGIGLRLLSYISFAFSGRYHARKYQADADVVVATSPQFFCAVAGYLVARKLKLPFILEIRDLWPESIVAVGAVNRNLIIRLFEKLELFLYKKADHIIAVTEAFKSFIQNKGIPPEKISVVKNGADLSKWTAPLDAGKLQDWRRRLGADGKFVVSFIGTIGMAHRVDVMLDAARMCTDEDVQFLVVGTGAERDNLEKKATELGLDNFTLAAKVESDEVPYLLAISDASLVHLRDSPLFETVIPSKIFEAMATRTPIILGVKGEAREIVESAGAGIFVQPENGEELLAAVIRLKNDSELADSMGDHGWDHVTAYYDRSVLADRMSEIMESCQDRSRST